MKKFKEFEIHNQQVILGGKMKPTEWENTAGTESGTDIYDAETGNFAYTDQCH